MGMEGHGEIMAGETRRTQRRTVPVPLCPPQILNGLNRARTRTSAVERTLLQLPYSSPFSGTY
jgi:hypothetical protein